MTTALDLSKQEKTGTLTVKVSFNDVGLIKIEIEGQDQFVSEDDQLRWGFENYMRLYQAERNLKNQIYQYLERLIFSEFKCLDKK